MAYQVVDVWTISNLVTVTGEKRSEVPKDKQMVSTDSYDLDLRVTAVDERSVTIRYEISNHLQQQEMPGLPSSKSNPRGPYSFTVTVDRLTGEVQRIWELPRTEKVHLPTFKHLVFASFPRLPEAGDQKSWSFPLEIRGLTVLTDTHLTANAEVTKRSKQDTTVAWTGSREFEAEYRHESGARTVNTGTAKLEGNQVIDSTGWLLSSEVTQTIHLKDKPFSKEGRLQTSQEMDQTLRTQIRRR